MHQVRGIQGVRRGSGAAAEVAGRHGHYPDGEAAGVSGKLWGTAHAAWSLGVARAWALLRHVIEMVALGGRVSK